MTIQPTSIGATNPMTLAAPLVRPIRVPAKLGARSIWLTPVEAQLALAAPVATHKSTTTSVESHPAKARAEKASAGARHATVANVFLVDVTDMIPFDKIQSARELRGSASRNPTK